MIDGDKFCIGSVKFMKMEWYEICFNAPTNLLSLLDARIKQKNYQNNN